jgi:hypothetical protein
MTNEEMRQLGKTNARLAIESQTAGTKKVWNELELDLIEVQWRDNTTINLLEQGTVEGHIAYNEGVMEAIKQFVSRQER